MRNLFEEPTVAGLSATIDSIVAAAEAPNDADHEVGEI